MQYLMEQVADNQNPATGGNISGVSIEDANNADNGSKEQNNGLMQDRVGEPGEAEGIIDGDVDGIDGDKEEVEGYIWESM